MLIDLYNKKTDGSEPAAVLLASVHEYYRTGTLPSALACASFGEAARLAFRMAGGEGAGFDDFMAVNGAASREEIINELERALAAQGIRGGAASLTPARITEVKGRGFLHCRGTDCFNCRVITRNGRITSDQASRIAEAARLYGNGKMALTTRLTVEIQEVPDKNIEALTFFLAEGGLETGGTGAKVRPVVSCKGTICVFGLCDTFALSEEAHRRFYEGYRSVKLPHKFKIAVGGCPNNCTKPDLNDVGVIGQRRPKVIADKCRACKKCAVEAACPIKVAKLEDGVIRVGGEGCNNCGRCVGNCPFGAVEKDFDGFKVYIGGRWGKKSAIGRELSVIFGGDGDYAAAEDEVLRVIERTLIFFRERGYIGERFADTIGRVGFDEVERELLSNEILARRDAILAAPLNERPLA